jgi:tetratricopeptide (TPR) repeat protein
VSEFDNRTGESVLDGTLSSAAERELEYSDFIRAAQRDRIEDALKLLERPLDSPLNKELALELAQRDGGIRAVVTGSIARVNDEYALTVEVIDPASRMLVATLTERPLSQREILASVRRQILRIREALGEPARSIERGRDAILRASLPSLTAMHLRTRAKRLIDLRRPGPLSTWVTVEKIARDVVQEDPTFVLGPSLLAWSLANQGRPAEALIHAEQALSLVDGATPPERYFIVASVHGFRSAAPDGVRLHRDRQELEKAAAAMEALFALQPDHYAVRNNLRNVYEILGRTRDVAWMNQRIADARPWSVADNFAVATQLLRDGNIDGAHQYGTRAASSLSAGSSAAEPDVSASVRLFPAYVAWARDDPNEALQMIRQVAGSIGTVPEPERRRLYLRVGIMYAAMGRLREAVQAVDAARPPDRSDHANTTDVDLARAAIYGDAGDPAGLRAFAETWWREPLAAAAPALLGRRIPYLIDAGMLAIADRDLEWFKQRTAQPGEWAPRATRRSIQPFYESSKAIVAIKRQQRAGVDLLREQMPLLQDGPPWLLGPAGSHTYFAAMNLAEALAAQGSLQEAIATLEQAVRDRVAVINSNTPNRWLRANAQLASLYRRNAQEHEARAVEARLLKLLAHADADHPLASQLKGRR